MKIVQKWFLAALSAALLLLMPVDVSAVDAATSGVCGENVTWAFDAATGTLTLSGEGEMWFFYAGTEGYHERPWESLTDQITSVVIEDGITYLGSWAFLDCVNLTSVTFCSTLEEIGYWAFANSTSLKDFVLPESLRSIQQGAFENCDQLTSVVLPASISFMDSAIFSGCDRLSSVVIKSDPNLGLFVAGSGAFENCVSLETITVEDGHIAFSAYDGVLFSGSELFQYPAGKQDTTWAVPEGTTSIFQSSFTGAAYLQAVTIPSSVAYIGDFAFDDCVQLKKVGLAEGLVEIRALAFRNTALSEIILPESLTFIGEHAFSACNTLTEIAIPAGITVLEENPFPWNAKVTIADGNTAYQLVDDILYDKPATKIVQVFDSISGEVTVLDGVTEIPYLSFWAKRDITAIDLPDSVVSVRSGAFEGCAGLTSIVIPNGVPVISDFAFSHCDNLTTVTIPSSVTAIDDHAFYDSVLLADVYYAGTEEQWATITIGSNNEPLHNATIHYNYVPEGGAEPEPPAAISTPEVTADEVSVEIVCQEGFTGWAYCAAYNEDGRMVSVEMKSVVGGSNSLDFGLDPLAALVNILVLGNDFAPQCENEPLPLQ